MSSANMPDVDGLGHFDPRFSSAIRVEIEAWRAENLISDELAEILSDRYRSSDAQNRSFSLGRLSSILAVMGAILVGLGVVGLIALNWEDLSDNAKLVLLVVCTTSAYLLGWCVAYCIGYYRIGMALILLGAILFGASIHLVAQSFNVEVNHPNLVTVWFLGVVPIAFVTRSYVVLALAIILFLSALGFRAQGWFIEDADFSPVTLYGLIAYLIAGGALFSLGRIHARLGGFRHFARAFEVWGFAIAVPIAFILSSISLWRESDAFGSRISPTEFVYMEYWITVICLVAIALSGMVLMARDRFAGGQRAERSSWELAGVLTILGLALLAYIGAYAEFNQIWIVFNIVLFAGIIAMINAGLRFGRGYLINISFILFGITVLTRYFEIAAVLGILDQAISYIFSGIILIALAFSLERARRNLVERMQREKAVA